MYVSMHMRGATSQQIKPKRTVAPLRAAVRLVYHDPRELPGAVHLLQCIEQGLGLHHLQDCRLVVCFVCRRCERGRSSSGAAAGHQYVYRTVTDQNSPSQA